MNCIPVRVYLQGELREKQVEMVKIVTAAENAINKLQVNAVTIEVTYRETLFHELCPVKHECCHVCVSVCVCNMLLSQECEQTNRFVKKTHHW